MNPKMIGLLIVAAASLMAFVSSASATAILTFSAGTEYTGEIHATIKPGTTLALSAGISDTCTEGTLLSDVETNNTTHASGKLTKLSFGSGATPCTKTTNVLKNGKLTISDKGTVIASENEVTVFDLGVSCIYGGAAGTSIGDLTPGAPAHIDINTTELPKISGGFLCASKGTWTGTFIVTTPKSLFLT